MGRDWDLPGYGPPPHWEQSKPIRVAVIPAEAKLPAVEPKQGL